jgi:acetolactate synthase-1/2/3 large subunit
VALAEKLAIPVATSLNAKGTISDSHALSVGCVGTYSRASANRAVSEADLVFFIGSHTGGQVTTEYTIPAPGTAVIQLDIDPLELGRNYPNAVPLLGDAKTTLRHLLDVAERRPQKVTQPWAERVQRLVAEWRALEAPQLNSDAVPMRPERVCRAISQILPADGVVVSDTGHSGIWSGTMIDFLRPGQRYIRCAGSLGWGLPGALVLVINNTSALSQEIFVYDRAYGGKMRGNADELWRFRQVNFAEVAKTFGCAGLRVERTQDLGDALKQALGMNCPVVIDAVTDTYAVARSAWVPAA